MHAGSFWRPFLLVTMLAACKSKEPSKETIAGLNLKRGEVIACGPGDKQFGSVAFETSCKDSNFRLGVQLLHSFEYDEAEKVFAKVIDAEPGCAMAYWGVAMSNFHALWAPPTEAELKKGAKAVEIAQSIKAGSEREEDYIDAIASFYKDWDKVDHRTRCQRFEQSMEGMYKKYPADPEAAIFYSLALNAAADPTDKTFVKQKQAGNILNALVKKWPKHPGVVHYIIHTYDYPELAQFGLDAAREYAFVAPSSAHALHMPSHIFTRLGLWDECINSNKASVSSAQCYAAEAGIKGHWDEEMHGLDYLVYGFLQKGQNNFAKMNLDYMRSIREVHPANFKVAYAFAAIPARYVLENRVWKEAAVLEPHTANINWKDFQWQMAIVHFARVLGAAHINNMDAAYAGLGKLNEIHQTLLQQKDAYKANQVNVQAKTGEAWIRVFEGKKDEALKLMNLAADLEDKTEKHPVTPGEVIPARELLGDMYMEYNDYANALKAYEASLERHHKRFNGLYGAALAAEKTGDLSKATHYYMDLVTAAGVRGQRNEVTLARTFLTKQGYKGVSELVRL